MKPTSAAVRLALKDLINDSELIGLKEFGTAVGTDSVGQPAIYVWAILTSPTSKKATALENYERIRCKVEKAIADAGIEGYEWIYVNLTDEASFIVNSHLDEQPA